MKWTGEGLLNFLNTVDSASATGKMESMERRSWNIQALRDHVERLGHSKFDPVPQTIRSVDRTLQIFNYHLFAARDALKGHINEDDASSDANFMLLLGVRTEEYVLAKLASEAHLIGSFHTARSVFDIFSHVVNGLLLNNMLSVKQCDIHKVRKHLPKGQLRTSLDQLVDSYWFSYVTAFINTTKHRGLVEHVVHVDLEENVAGVRLGAFEYDGRQYPEYWGNEVLRGVIEVKNQITSCGQALNAACGIAVPGTN